MRDDDAGATLVEFGDERIAVERLVGDQLVKAMPSISSGKRVRFGGASRTFIDSRSKKRELVATSQWPVVQGSDQKRRRSAVAQSYLLHCFSILLEAGVRSPDTHMRNRPPGWEWNVMNTNSIWFRAALSMAMVWIMIAAYQAYSYYDGLIAAEKVRKYDQSRYDDCSNEQLDISGGQMQFRRPTLAEQDTCRRIIDKVTADFEKRRTLWDRLLNERLAVGRFFYRGLVPMGVLLLLIACWPKLKAGGVFYIDWLKNGSRKTG